MRLSGLERLLLLLEKHPAGLMRMIVVFAQNV